jgi:cytochrome bd-type quinol oxidase subunit 2
MKEVWSKKWKGVFLWLSGYLSIIAFAIVGGYTIVKSEDDDLKKTAKSVLIVTLIFTAISALLTIVSTVGGMFDGYYNSDIYAIYKIVNAVSAVVKIAVFALSIIFEFVKKEEKKEDIE